MAVRLDAKSAGFAHAFDRLVEGKRDQPLDVRETVSEILARVEADGDDALLAYTRTLDRLDLSVDRLKIGPDEIEAAWTGLSAELRDALTDAHERIIAFHRRQVPDDLSYTDELGVTLGQRWRPVDAAGLYVPGGTAAYPSSVLMNGAPARIAGVGRLVMAVPTPDGRLSPLVLAAARLLEADEVYRIGGAQAIGALAFGTETIAPVDKVVGPGNAYVAEAKRQVFGRVGIDMIAGPSEIVVVAGRGQNAGWIAADLLSQAEHDELAQAILITDDPALADAVEAEVARQLEDLPRRAIAEASWQAFGAVIVVGDLADAPALVNRLAPEHLELVVDTPAPLVDAIRHAGSIFLGPFTPEVIGDYVGGPNHVLPTGRSARFASGLSVFDFLKRTTLLGCDARTFAALGPTAKALALAEGLDGHAQAIEVRR